MFVVTDAAGPVGSIVASALSAAGEEVRSIDTESDGIKGTAKDAAELWSGDLTHRISLARAFQGASAAFLALPYQARRRDDFCEYQDKISDAYAAAVADSGIRYVVSQSCAGVHQHPRSEFLAGFHRFEEKLNRIPQLNILHLRPAHFPEHLGAELIESLNIVVGAIAPGVPLPIVFPGDVGTFAAERMRKRDFEGQQVQELLGQRDVTMEEFAAILGRALGRPKLHYVQLSTGTMEQWLIRVGLPQRSARLVMEVWTLANQGLLTPVEQRSAQNTTPTSIERFLVGTFRPSGQNIHTH